MAIKVCSRDLLVSSSSDEGKILFTFSSVIFQCQAVVPSSASKTKEICTILALAVCGGRYNLLSLSAVLGSDVVN